MSAKTGNPLVALSDFGQSPWLDYIRRSLMTSGELQSLIEKDGVKGVTSNPAIFEKAIAGSTDYSEWLEELRAQDLAPKELYERLAVRDVQAAADVMKTVYDCTRRRDGYVSLEVSPYLANDSEGTVKEARRLWKAVSRENLMIKVPASDAGLPAIETLIGEGINVNATLLFSRQVYERVARAYLTGLETWASGGGDLGEIASVASFFVSRIDVAVDALLQSRLQSAEGASARGRLEGLQGKIAVANAKLAYESYQEIFRGERFKALAERGAQTQRLLWASTGTKNPAYSDVLYVEELIGQETVNTIPTTTLNAYRDHGKPQARLERDVDGARARLAALSEEGISLDRITDQLLEDGVRSFAAAFDKLLNALDDRCKADTPSDQSTFVIPGSLNEEISKTIRDDWQAGGKMRRLWARDASLWTGGDESRWLGWLQLTDEASERASPLRELAAWVAARGFSDAVVLGMGGSSLCPDVLSRTYGHIEGFPALHILDSTDPAQIRALEDKLDLTQTLFIVSSKSGTTLEPNIFMRYFLDRVRTALAREDVADRFIAVTDPGSKLETLAREKSFHAIFAGVPSVGGRYAALSNFGMVPGAVMGLDVADFLERAHTMAVATSSCVPAADNPGTRLGIVLGVLASRGRDKLTLVISPRIRDLGAWLEQLIAESTGKLGKGIIPVDREPLGAPDVYGEDRVFAYVRLETDADASQDAAVEALEASGQPVVRLPLGDVKDLGQAFFRWQIATAVAGSILGINPFDQPDVEASKVMSRKLTEQVEKTGALPDETPLLEDQGIRLFADDRNHAELEAATAGNRTVASTLRAHLNRVGKGDYIALLAYIQMNQAHEDRLQELRVGLRDHKRVATCLGFGPRFLHSTGQAYKGGPNTGVFLQITCDDIQDLPVPGRPYTFGIVKAAQARGDFQILAQRRRRALRVHLGSDVAAGLSTLQAAFGEALAG
ncbi:MAG: bifunctional transaldolase/phosoglucose isomerase [Gammaproteobacteria bacterium]|nr:MAG: bifunctional transaldolase/phosoglucose isomerase [Gammaproteobacteria bacterium]